MFKVGQKIVCKDNSNVENVLSKSIIYTIERFSCCPCCGQQTIVLEEINSSKYINVRCRRCDGVYSASNSEFSADRFEPLKLDLISNFDAITEVWIKEEEKVLVEV